MSGHVCPSRDGGGMLPAVEGAFCGYRLCWSWAPQETGGSTHSPDSQHTLFLKLLCFPHASHPSPFVLVGVCKAQSRQVGHTRQDGVSRYQAPTD